MANQYAAISPDQQKALLGNSGTANASLEARRIVASEGNMHVSLMGGLIPPASYDNIVTTYPDGTTEVYTYKSGTTPTGTTTAVYLDTTKGSISTVTRT